MLNLVNDQVILFLTDNKILIEFQSGFRSGHSTITAAMLVTNDIVKYLDSKQHCAALFIDNLTLKIINFYYRD